ncbi:hypothetical protein V5799_022733 [Amblyomma americanum]|uniref:Uncharacterized protein n=1 Tax=Amblyomma americanum TaxID=6943 RepID=A0AAQ4FLX7_AMBAM
MLSPTILHIARLLVDSWSVDGAAGLLSVVLHYTYLSQLFHGMGLPPHKSILVAALCCLIRVCAVPSLMRLTYWVV